MWPLLCLVVLGKSKKGQLSIEILSIRALQMSFCMYLCTENTCRGTQHWGLHASVLPDKLISQQPLSVQPGCPLQKLTLNRPHPIQTGLSTPMFSDFHLPLSSVAVQVVYVSVVSFYF